MRAQRAPSREGARENLVAVLADLTLVREVENYFDSLGTEVYGDDEPLRWLSILTDLKKPPDIVLIDVQLKGQDCSLLLDIVRRRWIDQHPKVLLIGDESDGRSLLALANVAPVLRRPLTRQQLCCVAAALSGESSLPAGGFI